MTVSTNSESTPSQLTHTYVTCELQEKLEVLYSFIKSHLTSKILVFMSSCKQVRLSCTYATHTLHIRYTYATHSAHCCTYATHTLHIRYTYATHTLYIRYTYATHKLHILRTVAHTLHILRTVAQTLHILRTVAHTLHILRTVAYRSSDIISLPIVRYCLHINTLATVPLGPIP